MMKADKIQYPFFDEIVIQCKGKIDDKFAEYGNSWKENPFTMDWWEKRLKKEIKEIFEAKSVEEYVDEIPDAINILSMMFSRSIQPCSRCGLMLTSWHSLDNKILCAKCFFGW